jgi:hypothetical protein
MGVEPTISGLAILCSHRAAPFSWYEHMTEVGFEPTKLTQKIYNLPLLTTQAPDRAEARGIEPLFQVLKTSVLPLNYTSKN